MRAEDDEILNYYSKCPRSDHENENYITLTDEDVKRLLRKPKKLVYSEKYYIMDKETGEKRLKCDPTHLVPIL